MKHNKLEIFLGIYSAIYLGIAISSIVVDTQLFLRLFAATSVLYVILCFFSMEVKDYFRAVARYQGISQDASLRVILAWFKLIDLNCYTPFPRRLKLTDFIKSYFFRYKFRRVIVVGSTYLEIGTPEIEEMYGRDFKSYNNLFPGMSSLYYNKTLRTISWYGTTLFISGDFIFTVED